MQPEARAATVRLLEGWSARRSAEAEACFEAWLEEFGALYGKRFLNPGERETRALQRHYGAHESAGFHELLFCAHTCFAMAVERRAAVRGDPMFRWAEAERLAVPPIPAEGGRDLFKPLYQELVPRTVRHALGEYYTPNWLAELMLDEGGYNGDPEKRLLDPSCGSGTFLVLAIGRARDRGATAGEILRNVHGFELNPLAALAARANYRLALGEAGASVADAEIPVRQVDAVIGAIAAEPFDFIAGNPPWVRWDYLPEEYRARTLPLWKSYGLFTLRGFEARLGGGKKDLAMLFTYAAADRFLKRGGRLAFLVTQEVFKSKGAGEGFRGFRLGKDGEPLRVLAAHDFAGLQPFEGATNKTAAIILTKGEETAYPVPYFVWERSGDALRRTRLMAQPLGSPRGPWLTVPEGTRLRFPLSEDSPYQARLGANANPYGVFWLEVLESLPGGMARVRNLAEMGKRAIPAVTTVIEAELVHPALRGSDIMRWGARPGVHVLVVQDPRTRCGYSEAVLRANWPRTAVYLDGFRDELLSRALYRKYHRESGHPYYSQFNVSVETFAPFKVVWKRMSNDLCAAVVSCREGPLGGKTVIPLETTSLVAAASEQEAHYLCAVMNSTPVREFVRSFSAAGRGFGTPSVLKHIGIPRFDRGDAAHRELAELSRELHERCGEGGAELEGRVDQVVWGLCKTAC